MVTCCFANFLVFGCNASYVGRTNRCFHIICTCVRAFFHRLTLSIDLHSHMYSHLDFLLSNECFKIIDSPSSHFQLTIKESMETDSFKNATKTS